MTLVCLAVVRMGAMYRNRTVTLKTVDNVGKVKFITLVQNNENSDNHEDVICENDDVTQNNDESEDITETANNQGKNKVDDAIEYSKTASNNADDDTTVGITGNCVQVGNKCTMYYEQHTTAKRKSRSSTNYLDIPSVVVNGNKNTINMIHNQGEKTTDLSKHQKHFFRKL